MRSLDGRVCGMWDGGREQSERVGTYERVKRLGIARRGRGGCTWQRVSTWGVGGAEGKGKGRGMEGSARGVRGEGEGRARGGRERGANGEGLKGDLESVRVRSEEEMSNRGPNLLSSLGICSLRMATGRHNQEPSTRQRSGIFSLCRMTSTIVSTPHFPTFQLVPPPHKTQIPPSSSTGVKRG